MRKGLPGRSGQLLGHRPLTHRIRLCAILLLQNANDTENRFSTARHDMTPSEQQISSV